MSGHSPKRWNIWVPLLVFLLLVTGIFIGFELNKYFFYKRPIATVIERNDRLEEIIDLINQRYVDSVDKDSLYADAIKGILKHLDPHTTYIPARDMAKVNNELKGNFQGIGVEFFILKDTITIADVIENSPAREAGVETGDQLIKIDTSLVAGNNITNRDIKRMLEGKADSKITLTISRYGVDTPLLLPVKRGLVPLLSVDAAYMIDPETGYIKINRFSATTYREFIKSLNYLLKKGMTSLVLDLRQNPGGYLDAATAIADEFINNHKLIVYTKGRAMPKEAFKADKKGLFEKGKLIVLVDEGSASASEVLAGAVQDWDRGVIVGRRTFGKGLVQEQYELTDGSALRLTVARYYTPSGRNIQRPYDHGKTAYEQAYLQRFEHVWNWPDTVLTTPDTTKYYTEEKHRVVYGGGGIRPDVIVPLQQDAFPGSLYDLLTSEIIEGTVYKYYVIHKEQFRTYQNFADFNSDFSIKPDLLKHLKNNFGSQYAQQVKQVWRHPQAVSYLSVRMKALFARILFGNKGYYHILNEQDTVLKKALQVLRTDAYSQIMSGKA